jgi:cell division transport system permease protein
LIGGATGTVLAILTLAGLTMAISRQGSGLAGAGGMSLSGGATRFSSFLDQSLSLGLSFTPWHWAALAILPIAAAILAMLTARWTVLRSIHRIM